MTPDLHNIKMYMNSIEKTSTTCCSNVYYMEIVDDSVDTLLYIAEDIQEKLKNECQDNYVILVGDGKTYKHLMHIKQRYLNFMEKLLVIGIF